MKIEVRPERPEDFTTIATLTRLAFDKTNGAEVAMIAGIRQSDSYVPELSLVAVLDGQIVGHAMFHREILQGERPVRVMDLGPVGVLPEHQRRGVGTALIEYGLKRCHERSEPLVTCLGHDDYYPRFGFVRAEHFGIEPFWNAMMVCPILPNLERFRGLRYPHDHNWGQV